MHKEQKSKKENVEKEADVGTSLQRHLRTGILQTVSLICNF